MAELKLIKGGKEDDEQITDEMFAMFLPHPSGVALSSFGFAG